MKNPSWLRLRPLTGPNPRLRRPGWKSKNLHIQAIGRLIEKFEYKLPEETISRDRYHFFDELSSFYISARCLDCKKKMSELPDKSKAEILLTKTEETFSWLMTLKP
jgi:hypothetical protein